MNLLSVFVLVYSGALHLECKWKRKKKIEKEKTFPSLSHVTISLSFFTFSPFGIHRIGEYINGIRDWTISAYKQIGLLHKW